MARPNSCAKEPGWTVSPAASDSKAAQPGTSLAFESCICRCEMPAPPSLTAPASPLTDTLQESKLHALQFESSLPGPPSAGFAPLTIPVVALEAATSQASLFTVIGHASSGRNHCGRCPSFETQDLSPPLTRSCDRHDTSSSASTLHVIIEVASSRPGSVADTTPMSGCSPAAEPEAAVSQSRGKKAFELCFTAPEFFRPDAHDGEAQDEMASPRPARKVSEVSISDDVSSPRAARQKSETSAETAVADAQIFAYEGWKTNVDSLQGAVVLAGMDCP